MADNGLLGRFQLIVDPSAQILICCRADCCFALSPIASQVSDHLRDKHHVPSEERREVTRFLRYNVPPLRNPIDAPPREDGSPRDPYLPVADGFTCKFCDNRTINKRSIIRHVTKVHESTRLRMGVKKVALYEPVYLQSWTRNPAEGWYWSVEKNGSGTQPAGDAETYVHLGGVFVREQRRIESLGAGQEAAATVTAGRSTFSELRPWLERTGWEQTYADVNRNLLRSLTIAPLFRSFPTKRLSLGNSGSGVGRARLDEDVVSPADDERKLAAISAAIDRVMERCEQTARTSDRIMLCWLQSARPYASYTKPFRFVARTSTRKSYFGLLKRFIAMVFRAYRLSAHLRQRATGIRFKKAQLKSIAAIWNHSVWDQDGATTFDFWRPTKGCDMSGSRVDGEEGDECEDSASEQDDDDHDNDNGDGTEDESLDDNRSDGEGDDEDAESEDDEIAADPRAALIDEVLELLFGLMIQFSTEEIMDGRPASALLVYFSGVLGFSTDCAGFSQHGRTLPISQGSSTSSASSSSSSPYQQENILSVTGFACSLA